MQDRSVAEDDRVLASCIICGSGNYSEIFDIEVSPLFAPSKLVKCKNCGLFYASPRPARNIEEKYYAERYHEDQENGYWYDGRIGLFKRSLCEISRFLNKGRLIDVGCGMGYFMDLARSKGWEAMGVEISESAFSHARNKLRLDVIKGDLSGANFKEEYFDAATLWNALDQIYDPRSTLIELNRVLKRGGYIFIRVPNIDFHLMLFKLWKKLKPRLADIGKAPAVFHLYSFDKASIKKLLESTGFSDVAVKTETIGAGVPNFVRIFGKIWEGPARAFFDAGAKALYFLSLGKVIMSPSIFVIARKKRT